MTEPPEGLVDSESVLPLAPLPGSPLRLPDRNAYTAEQIYAMYEGTIPVTPADEVMDHHVRLRADCRDPVMLARLRSLMDYSVEAHGFKSREATMNALFYPAQDYAALAGLFSRELFTARTYQVTSEMVDAVNGTYRKSADTVGWVEEDEVPSEAGFVWLDKPFLMVDRWGRLTTSRAVSWSTQVIQWPGRPRKDALGRPAGTHPPTKGMGVRMTCWHYQGDIDSYSGDKDDPAPPSGLIVGHTVLLPFGQRFGGPRMVNESGDQLDDFAHWMHVLWAFMEMEITTLRQSPLGRYARDRARGLKHAPKTVNVITLRRSASKGLDDAEEHHRAVDWSCRWVVQGHLRHVGTRGGPNHKAVRDFPDRGICAVCGGKITWVKAHLRGPDDMPLKVTPQLYRLER